MEGSPTGFLTAGMIRVEIPVQGGHRGLRDHADLWGGHRHVGLSAGPVLVDVPVEGNAGWRDVTGQVEIS